MRDTRLRGAGSMPPCAVIQVDTEECYFPTIEAVSAKVECLRAVGRVLAYEADDPEAARCVDLVIETVEGHVAFTGPDSARAQEALDKVSEHAIVRVARAPDGSVSRMNALLKAQHLELEFVGEVIRNSFRVASDPIAGFASIRWPWDGRMNLGESLFRFREAQFRALRQRSRSHFLSGVLAAEEIYRYEILPITARIIHRSVSGMGWSGVGKSFLDRAVDRRLHHEGLASHPETFAEAFFGPETARDREKAWSLLNPMRG